MLALAAALTGAPLPAAGSCAAPAVAVVERPDGVEVRGQAFVRGCQDTCSCTGVGGCQRCDCGPPPEPVVRVDVQLLDARRQVVAEQRVEPADGAFAVTLPATPSAAVVVVRGTTAEGAPVVVEQSLPG